MNISCRYLRHRGLFLSSAAVLTFTVISLFLPPAVWPREGAAGPHCRFYRDDATGKTLKTVVTRIDDPENTVCRETYEYDPASSRKIRFTREEYSKDGKPRSVETRDYSYDKDGDMAESRVALTRTGSEDVMNETYNYDKRTGQTRSRRLVTAGKNGTVKRDHLYNYDDDEKPVLVKKTFMDAGGKVDRIVEQTFEYDRSTGKIIGGAADISDGAGVVISHNEYAYDALGRISKYVKVLSGTKNDIRGIFEYLYQYDGVSGHKVSSVSRIKDIDGTVLREDTALYDRKTGLKRSYVRKDIAGVADLRQDAVSYDPVSGVRKLYSRVVRDARTGERVSARMAYDKAGRLIAISEKYFDSAGKNYKTAEEVYAYDAPSGRRKACTRVSRGPGGNIIRKENYAFDTGKDSVTEHLTAEFDENGKMVFEESYVYDVDGNTASHFLKECDQRTGGALEKEYKYKQDGKIAEKREKRYDKEGQCVSVSELLYRYKAGSDMKSETVLKETDIPGGAVREEVVRYDTENARKAEYAETQTEYDGRLRNKYVCTFNGAGKVSTYKNVFFVEGEGEREESGEYKYDPSGGGKISWERVIRDAKGNETRIVSDYDKDTSSRKSYVSIEKTGGVAVREQRYKYGELGRLVSASCLVSDESGELVSESEAEYAYFSGSGDLERKEKITRLPREKAARKERYLFDAETGKKKECVTEVFSDEDGVSRSEERVYDKKARLVSLTASMKKKADDASIVTDRQSYTYGEGAGRALTFARIQTDPDSAEAKEELYAYDPVSGKTVKYDRKVFRGGKVVLEEKYEYDAGNGRKLSYHEKDISAADGTLRETNEDYDVLGRLLSSSGRIAGAGGETKYLNEYKYSYDDTTGKNVILTHRVTDKEKGTERSESYTFDPGSGNKTRYVVEESVGGVIRRDTYLYDAGTGAKNSYLTLVIDRSGAVIKGSVYEYDQAGKVKKLSKTYPVKKSGDIRLEEYVFRYDRGSGERIGYSRLGKDLEGYILEENVFDYSPRTGLLVRYAGTTRDKTAGEMKKESYDYDAGTGKKSGYRVSRVSRDGTEVSEDHKYNADSGKMISCSKVLKKKGMVVSDDEYLYDYDAGTGCLAGYVRTEKDRNGKVVNNYIFSYDEENRALFMGSPGGIVTNKPDYQLKYTKNGKPHEKTLRLHEGLNEITIDNSGYGQISLQVFLDTVPPVIDADPLAITNDPEYVLNYLSDGKPGQKVFKLTEGLCAFELTEKDEAGNESVYSFDVLLDTIPPEVKVISGSVAAAPAYTLVYTVDGLEKTKQYMLDEGDNEILIRETDAAGNCSEIKIKVELDSIPPVISADPPRVTNNPLYALTYEVDGVKTTKALDLKEGDNHVELTEKDAAGNETVFPFDITLYSEPPQITASPPGFTNDPEIDIEYTVDGAAKKEHFKLAEGDNELSITEGDPAGGGNIFSFNVVLDTDVPEGKIKAHFSGKTKDGLIIEPFAEDNTTSVVEWRYKIDGSGWSGWLLYPPLASDRAADINGRIGDQNLTVEFRDAAGNVSGASCRIGAGSDRGGEDIEIEVRGNIYEEGGVFFLGSEDPRIKDILDVVFLKGFSPEGTAVEFRARNEMTREEWITPVVFPGRTSENIFDIYSEGKAVKRAVKDCDRIGVAARIAGTDSAQPGKWSDPVFFVLDNSGPEVEADLRRINVKGGITAVLLDLYANDDGSDVRAWRYKTGGTEWSDWKTYPSPRDERVLDFGDTRGVHEAEVEVVDRAGNLKKSRASFIF